jgi:hypothetical protein
VNLLINLLCVVGSVSLAIILSKRFVVSDNFWVCAGVSFAFLTGYVAARLCHISFVLIPLNGGITWQKPARLLALSLLLFVAAVFFYLKDRNGAESSKRK